MKKLQILMVVSMVIMGICVEQVSAVSKTTPKTTVQNSSQYETVESYNTGANYLPDSSTPCVCGQHCSGQTIQQCVTNARSNLGTAKTNVKASVKATKAA